MGLPPGYLYCERKFNKVCDSGRYVKLIRPKTEKKGLSLKNALLGRDHYPNLFIQLYQRHLMPTAKWILTG